MSNDALTLAQMRSELRGVRAELRRVRRELTRAHAENIHYRHVLEDVARTAKTSVDSGYSLRGLRLAYIARITRPFRPDGGDTRDAERLSENARLVEMLMRQVNVWTERFCSDPDATDEQRRISQLLGEAIGRAHLQAFLALPRAEWPAEGTASEPMQREHPHAGSEEAPALAAWMTTVLEPLLAELGTSRQRIEDLARENGRQAAELEALRAQNAALLASTATERPDPSTAIRPERRS
jgi:hypothetical protein